MKKKETLTITEALESLSHIVDYDADEASLIANKEDEKALIERYSRPEEIYIYSIISFYS
ncbi:hypothetical protein AB751O23_AZ_00030 [Chlamydiales bacterium SCGC AB-751-O23]|nr:hypothetical protein AB751O23_AZ_00030 [Chlamydiales bacterium SCGC AB-751-O23]